MKRHLLHFIIATLLMIVGSINSLAAGQTYDDHADAIGITESDYDNAYRLTDLSRLWFPSSEAIIGNAGGNLHHFCNSRPLRLVPCSHARFAKSAARHFFLYHYNILKSFYGRKSRHQKSPEFLSVSSDYFIVLRHIIR